MVNNKISPKKKTKMALNSIINTNDELKSYKKQCHPHNNTTQYTEWKDNIRKKIDLYDVTELENYKHLLMYNKRIEDTMMPIPENVFGFAFGGAIAGLIAKYSIIILVFLIAIIILVPVYMFIVRKMNLKSEYYGDLIDIVQEAIEDKRSKK